MSTANIHTITVNIMSTVHDKDLDLVRTQNRTDFICQME